MTFANDAEQILILVRNATARKRKKRTKTALVLIYYPFVNAIGIQLPD